MTTRRPILSDTLLRQPNALSQQEVPPLLPTAAQRWEVKLTRVLASHGTPRRPFGPKTGAIRALVFDSKCLSATCSNVCCAETTRLGTRNASYMLTMLFRGRRAARLGKTTCAHCARRAMSVAVTASQTRDFKIGLLPSNHSATGRAPFTRVQALLAKERITNSGSAAMTIRSARAAASGWRRPDSQ